MSAAPISFDGAVTMILATKQVDKGLWAAFMAWPICEGVVNRRMGETKIKGIVPTGMTMGDRITCTGKTNSAGELTTNDITLIMPEGPDLTRDYLAHSAGVGRVTADRIAQAYAPELLIIPAIMRDAERLAEVVGGSVANKIIAHLRTKWRFYESSAKLRAYGLKAQDVRKACMAMAMRDINTVPENPFELVSDLGFPMCDVIAKGMRLDTNAPERLDAGIPWIAENQCKCFGHCAVIYDSLAADAADKLEVDYDDIISAMTRLLETRQLISATMLGQHLVYPLRFWRAEQETIACIAHISTAVQKDWSISVKDEFKPSEDQAAALDKIAGSNVSILTGPPGSGKTSILMCVVDSAEAADMKVLLCAPTGIAARRMKQACGRNPTTIHRALNSPDLPVAQVVVIDEMSMVSIELFRDLLSRMRSDAILILVGDPEQLPSIAPGNVLADLIDSGAVSTSCLVKIHRQGEGGVLCENIARIRRGEMPVETPGNNELIIRYFDDVGQIANAVVHCANLFMGLDVSPDKLARTQVITPMNSGLLGTEGLNRLLRNKLNPQVAAAFAQDSRAEIAKYVVGDKVIQCENDYDRDVINGEIGHVESQGDVKEPGMRIAFPDHNVRYMNAEELAQLKHAYAITIHKSQGSEFPHLIIPLADCHGQMLTRRLLYTAFSRGKKKVVIAAQRSALEKAVSNNYHEVRYTGLAAGLAAKLAKRAE